MDDKYLKHRVDGTIFGWTEQLAKHPDLSEVTAEEAFPEMFMSKRAKARAAAVAAMAAAAAAKAEEETKKEAEPELPLAPIKTVVIGDLGEDPPAPVNEELSSDASQRLPE